MTLIIGARCNDGIVLIGDRKVTGGLKQFTDKIQRLTGLDTIVFTAAGLESLFEEFLDEVSRKVLHDARKIEVYNKKNPDDQQLEYSTNDFKHACADVLKTMKEYYSELEEHMDFENALQVLFVVPELCKDNAEQIYRLYGMNMLGCYPFLIDFGKIQQIGQRGIGDVFLKSLEEKEYTMKDVARVSAFVIKYVENEGLSESVGVGDGEPQIWFVDDKGGPREIEGKELHDLLEGIDGEIVNIQKKIGKSSSFLRA